MMNPRTPHHGDGSPQKMSGGNKVMLILLAVFSGIVLLCCGGGLFIYSRMRTEIYETPAEIAAVRDKIMRVDTPQRYEPMTGAEFDLLFYRSKMAIYHRREGVSQIAVVSVNVTFGQSDMNEARKQMREQGALPTELDDVKTESRTYKIDGEDVDVTFSHGKLKEDSSVFQQPGGQGGPPQPGAIPEEYAGKEWYAVQAMIPQSDGVVIFVVTGPEEEFDEQEIDAMLKSIHLQQAAAEK